MCSLWAAPRLWGAALLSALCAQPVWGEQANRDVWCPATTVRSHVRGGVRYCPTGWARARPWTVLLAGLEPANPFGYAILNRARFPAFATGADSPCLLVKGAGCAGVCLAVLAWLCPGLSRDARSRVALFSCIPALSEAGVRVASGATKLVPAFLSGLAQCRKQCPSVYAENCHISSGASCVWRFPFRASTRMPLSGST